MWLFNGPFICDQALFIFMCRIKNRRFDPLHNHFALFSLRRKGTPADHRSMIIVRLHSESSWFSRISSSYSVIVRVSVVLKRTVVGDGHQQQFFSELHSPGRSHYTSYWYSWVQTIYCVSRISCVFVQIDRCNSFLNLWKTILNIRSWRVLLLKLTSTE